MKSYASVWRPPKGLLPCPGSLRPVQHLQPGETVRCDFCGATVNVIPPPTGAAPEPYPGSLTRGWSGTHQCGGR